MGGASAGAGPSPAANAAAMIDADSKITALKVASCASSSVNASSNINTNAPKPTSSIGTNGTQGINSAFIERFLAASAHPSRSGHLGGEPARDLGHDHTHALRALDAKDIADLHAWARVAGDSQTGEADRHR